MYSSVRHDSTLVADQLRLVITVQHLAGDTVERAIAAGALHLSTDFKRWQDFYPRAVVADFFQDLAKLSNNFQFAGLWPGSRGGDDRQESCLHETLDALQGAVKRTFAANGVIGLRGKTVDRNTEFQGVLALLLSSVQGLQPLVFPDRTIGQYRGWSVLQCGDEDCCHLRVEKRLSTREVVLLDAQLAGFFQTLFDGLEGQESK